MARIGEIAVNWALDSHGILMRAEWGIDRYLKIGRLVLPQYFTRDADIHAAYPQRRQLPAREWAFADFVALEGKDGATHTRKASSCESESVLWMRARICRAIEVEGDVLPR